jgi:hypothetical protein
VSGHPFSWNAIPSGTDAERPPRSSRDLLQQQDQGDHDHGKPGELADPLRDPRTGPEHRFGGEPHARMLASGTSPNTGNVCVTWASGASLGNGCLGIAQSGIIAWSSFPGLHLGGLAGGVDTLGVSKRN